MASAVRWIRRLVVVVVIVIVLALLTAWLLLRSSLPQLSGSAHVIGLVTGTSIERDAMGVTSIRGASRDDVSFALGFVHAQERFFEMDLMRRAAAGELAELLGSAALPMDEERRPFRMRARAAQTLTEATSEESSALKAYRLGVNAGLQALDGRPWEYWLLGSAPQPWSEADTVLVMDAMSFDLNDSANKRELAFSQIRAALPESVYKFLSASGGPWDAPLLGPAMSYPPLPSAQDIDISKLDPGLLKIPPVKTERSATPGSNSFAVNGALTSTHAALVANDMHLGLRVPNIWFRARLNYPNVRRPGQNIDLIGVTLPGVPALVVGSNRHVVWAFTNSYGDWTDWVRVTLDATDKTQYRSREGLQAIRSSEEIIKVHNAPDQKIALRDTEWGPIIAEDADGTPLALAWTALQPDGVNLKLLHLDVAETADEAMHTANQSGMAPQNFIVGDTAGNIGWTIAGHIPRREGGYDPLLPADWSKPATGWNGWIDPAEYPRLPNPPGQRLWTANARTLDFASADFAHVGDGGFDLGARAHQIRDDLQKKTQFTPDDMLAIQLDDSAAFLKHWHVLLLKTLAQSSDAPALAEMAPYAKSWSEHADPGSVGYYLARNFRSEVTDTVMDGFGAAVRAKSPKFEMPKLAQAENMIDAILIQHPAHLLPPGYTSWDDLLRKCAERVALRVSARPGGFAEATWGDVSLVHIRHALSPALPGMGWLLDMPAEKLPGDSNMPRVQARDFGASERFAVEPGHEEFGYFHMPGGQSDNPLSPFYGAGHDDWAKGKPQPFMPGVAKYTLQLVPATP